MRKLLLYAMLLFAAASEAFGAEALLEYQIKAVCVLNAVRFVSWPASAFPSSDAPLIIGILGENPFGTSLQDVVKGETFQQRRIVVRRVRLEEAAAVHVLFISHSERDNLEKIFGALGDSSVLTISENDRFTQEGGMLGLRLAGGKIRFEVNPSAASRAQLKIHSQFLLLARGAR